MGNKKRNILLLLVDGASVLALTVLAIWLLRKGTVHFRPVSQWALGLLIVLPLLARPKRRTPAACVAHDAGLLLSASALGLLLTEYVVKGGILLGNREIWQGFLCYAAVFLLLYLLLGRIRPTLWIGQAVCMVYTLLDHYVLLFRGTPVLLSDALAIGTAANVAAHYSVPVERSVLTALCAVLLFALCVWRIGATRAPRKWQLSAAGVLAALWYAGLLIAGTSFGFWQGNRVYSELYYFCRSASNVMVQKPEGYGADAVAAAQAEYTGTVGEHKPNLIVVMNESFSDLRIIDDFETNVPFMPYVESLEENTVSGDLLISTFGGGTANTEFEFLTGDTLGFLPFGTSPYQLFVRSEMPTLVSGLRDQGYQTVAMHPYQASSWNRVSVYEKFGFEQALFETDFAPDADRVREYLSDKASYEKTIELYENKPEGQPLFLFNVTMQNHGGYDGVYERFDPQVRLTGEYEGQFPQTDTYLSLVKYSDDAVKLLIDYFSEVDEPTAIVFFGDHQPNVETEFFDALFGDTDETRTRESKQRKLQTPFFIWANYDIAEARDVELSVNYLSAYALDVLGCDLSGYDEQRLAMYEQVPRINSSGYYTADGAWHDGSTVYDLPALAPYAMTQYNHLFDPENRKDAWFQP